MKNHNSENEGIKSSLLARQQSCSPSTYDFSRKYAEKSHLGTFLGGKKAGRTPVSHFPLVKVCMQGADHSLYTHFWFVSFNLQGPLKNQVPNSRMYPSIHI